MDCEWGRMRRSRWAIALGLAVLAAAPAAARPAEPVPIDLSGYAAGCGVGVRRDGSRLRIDWPLSDGDRPEYGEVVLDLTAGRPLIESINIATSATAPAVPLLRGVDPVTTLTVGTRQARPGSRPPGRDWMVFFDKPASR